MPDDNKFITIGFSGLDVHMNINGIKACIDVDEASKATSLCRPTILELIRKGEIPAFRVKKRIVIPVVGLFDWAARRAREGIQSEIEA